MIKKTITVQLDVEVLQSMQVLADNNSRSRNAEIGVALKRYVAQELDGVAIQPQKAKQIDEVKLMPVTVVKDSKGLL